MTATGDWTPPPSPGVPPPPPTSYPGAPGWGVPPYTSPPRTNALAIVSLVAGCAQFFFCFLSSIVAVVTGHIARRQIRRTGEQGAGFALAGLILGYIGLALMALGIAGFAIFVFGFSGTIAENQARDNARAFGQAVIREATLAERPPRDPSLLRIVYVSETGSRSGCCDGNRIHLADGTPVWNATPTDFARAGWRLEFSWTVFYTRHACLTVPAEVTQVPVVVSGRCDGSAQGP
ncbi:MAG TPA: DUF4190 domain-containing protein [Acidimicrobiia bacterium]|nr:DUF4190 domain-containing protein [Acidimicrobiia bacterium]